MLNAAGRCVHEQANALNLWVPTLQFDAYLCSPVWVDVPWAGFKKVKAYGIHPGRCSDQCIVKGCNATNLAPGCRSSVHQCCPACCIGLPTRSAAFLATPRGRDTTPNGRLYNVSIISGSRGTDYVSMRPVSVSESTEVRADPETAAWGS